MITSRRGSHGRRVRPRRALMAVVRSTAARLTSRPGAAREGRSGVGPPQPDGETRHRQASGKKENCPRSKKLAALWERRVPPW